jgi:hypothetical protein
VDDLRTFLLSRSLLLSDRDGFCDGASFAVFYGVLLFFFDVHLDDLFQNERFTIH